MSGIGLLVQPLLGWRSWLSALTICPDAVVLDCRASAPDDVFPLPSEGFTLLVDQIAWPEWSSRFDPLLHDVTVVVSEPALCPQEAVPCVTSVDQLHQLAERTFSPQELWLLPGDVAGLCGQTAAFVLIQAALRLFPEACITLLSSNGPEVAAMLLRLGVDTILLCDQLTLLTDYPLPAERQRRIARLQRGFVRRYAVPMSAGLVPLQVAPLDPKDWRRTDPVVLERYATEHCRLVAHHGDERLTPMGEGMLLSAYWSEQGLTCSDLLGRYKRMSLHVRHAPATALDGRIAMASWLGTRLPVVQGPMTRVSDGADFAKAVADAGAMPVIAAAMLPAERLGLILRETASLCADHPWGVGLLAFRPQSDLQPQINEVLRAKPNFIVLAGGHSAQISQFGALADRVILHSPTPELFQRQLNEGCRRFILEGRECGGHTGPCSSLSLWEGCLKVLAQQPQSVQEETAILFAGGIQDEQSTLIIDELLIQFGLSDLCHGFLVGTLTLFSEEAVSTGAISPVFQRVLLDSMDTVLLETAPGHQSRCALTPFADEFLRERRQGLDEELSGIELAARLDQLILGRLRLASKGLQRQGDQLLPVSEDEQLRQGMFMVGEVAALQNRVAPLRALFDQLLPAPAEAHSHSDTPLEPHRRAPEPIAITGMAVAFPGAKSLTAYWSLIVRQKSQIRLVPEERWPADRYYTPEGSDTSVVSHWGTFIEPTVIDLAPYPLTPAQAAVTEPTQILALDLVSQALDAVRTTGMSAEQRERTAVVFAASGGAGELGQAYTIQTALASDPKTFGPWLDNLPTWTNSSFPGLLSNVTAGRVSNAFDLSGSNLLVDAACASALAAVDVAVAKLRSGECDRVIVGSVDNLQGPFPYFCFSQSGALSKQGQSRPFCTDSDGIVIGEGCAVVVLERLEMASRSGSTIYAVIDAIGSSSDGKGKSLTAPSHRGQILAFERAFEASDRHPSELTYYEAHGTGTPVGDRSEIAALTGFLRASGVTKQRCAVGSVKALVGHTKASAGLAGLIKAVLSLQHGTIPGQQPVRQPHPELTGEGPIYVPATPSPWPEVAGERLAAVSAFGFGGTNFTVLLSDRHRRLGRGFVGTLQVAPLPAALSVIALPIPGRDSVLALDQHCHHLDEWLNLLAGVNGPINTKILECPWLPIYSPTWPKTAFLALDRGGDDGLSLLNSLRQQLRGEKGDDLLHISRHDQLTPPPVVILFPGQGSAYPGMGAVGMLSSPRVRQALDLLQELHPDPDLLIRVLGGSRFETDRKAFWTPSVMQVVLMLHQLSALDWLSQLGLQPDAVLGHSIGDYLALHSSGALPLEGLVQLVVRRALCLERCIAAIAPESTGGMLVVKEPLDVCERRLDAFPELILANRNAPLQAVVAGPALELSSLQSLLENEAVEVMRLDLPVAYHHHSLEPAALDFDRCLSDVVLNPPAVQDMVRLSTNPGKELKTTDDVRVALRNHLCSQVDFVASVAHLENALPGAIFIDVGPRQTGSRLLQANGIDAHRILRMDDREDPVSQPIRVAFSLLNKGLSLDETVLMRLASEPRKTTWDVGSRRRLPYLVNGHAAVPLDGRPIPPSPLVPVSSPNVERNDGAEMPDPASDRLLEVYTEYQKTMRKFLESQDQVFSALTGGSSDGMVVAPTEPESPTSLSPALQFPEPLPLRTTADQPASSASPSLLQSQPEVAVASSAMSSVEQESPFSSQEAMQEFVREILVDRTGYPPELLEFEAHLESDLGIDSIKQVEVLGALVEALPVVPSPDQMQEIRAEARQKQTIQALAGFMLALHAGKA